MIPQSPFACASGFDLRPAESATPDKSAFGDPHSALQNSQLPNSWRRFERGTIRTAGCALQPSRTMLPKTARQTMSALLAMAFGEYMEFYRTYLMKQWNHMTPGKFVFILITVAVIGFIMMRSSTKAI
jgi:hypothetical protein